MVLRKNVPSTKRLNRLEKRIARKQETNAFVRVLSLYCLRLAIADFVVIALYALARRDSRYCRQNFLEVANFALPTWWIDLWQSRFPLLSDRGLPGATATAAFFSSADTNPVRVLSLQGTRT